MSRLKRIPGDGTFAPAVSYAMGENPQAMRIIAAGDFDGDGALDLAMPDGDSDTVSVLRNTKYGMFALPMRYAVGERPESITAGDFDNDGALDLAVTNQFSNTVSLLFNKGDGTFAAHVEYPAGPQPIPLTAGDFNGDGALDLVVGNYTIPGTIRVLPNQGNGTFAPPRKYYIGDWFTYSITISDFDRNGTLDLALTNNVDANTVSVLLNPGDGTFPQVSSYAVHDPWAVTAGDFDGDGTLDLVTGNDTGTVSVLFNRGDGTFAPAIDYTVELLARVNSLKTGDFDGDGALDLAVVFFSGGSCNAAIAVLWNKGNLNTREISLGLRRFIFILYRF